MLNDDATLKHLTSSNCLPPDLITPRSVNTFPNKLAANVPGNSPFYCFAYFYFLLFLIVSLIPFDSNSDSSSNLIIFIISFISLFEIINAVVPDAKIFF